MNLSTMLPQNNLILEDFLLFGYLPCQKIQFEFNGFPYSVSFNLLNEEYDEANLAIKSDELNIDIRANSYKINFDLEFAFEQQKYFFTSPQTHPVFQNEFENGTKKVATLSQLFELGQLLTQIIWLHYQNTHAESYFFIASDERLKLFYHLITRRYASLLGFTVRTNLGSEGLGYELKTPHFPSP